MKMRALFFSNLNLPPFLVVWLREEKRAKIQAKKTNIINQISLQALKKKAEDIVIKAPCLFKSKECLKVSN